MKTSIISLAFLLCLCQFVNAQTTDSPSSRNHFGVIASPTLDKVFTSNSNLPVGLIYKRQGKGNGMFRSTLMGSQSSHNNNNDQNSWNSGTMGPLLQSSQENVENNFFVQLTGGYEWHVQISNRWDLFYGAEAGPNHSRFAVEGVRSYPNNQGEGTFDYKYQNSYSGAIIRPFSGIAFHISDKLYIATETAIVASVYRYNSSSGNIDSAPRKYDYANQSSKGTIGNITYKPISNISLLMRF